YGLPLETFLWRLGHVVIAYGIAYGVYVLAGAANVGGGDLKLIIAIVPYVPGAYFGLLLVIWAAMTLVMVGMFFALRKLLRGKDYGFVSLGQKKHFPAGVSISGAILTLMGMQLAGSI
ncbi:MAG: hypothetical protein AAFP23_09185, partial [Pseudomonadota bacterium]